MWGTIGSALITGGLSYLGQKKANESNVSSAQSQMAFQKESAQNSYQWATADMKKAGINPMLAYQKGGASALSGAGYSAQNAIGAGVSSALSARRLAAEIKNIEQDTVLKRQQGYTVDTTGANNVITNQILRENLNSAKATAAAAKLEEQFFNSKVGKIMKNIDLMGRSINPFANSAKSLK